MTSLSREEYLKKYLSEDQTSNAKKKRRKKVKIAPAKLRRSRIVDDDVDSRTFLPSNLSNTLDEDVGDDDPTVADFIDERPDHVKILEKYRENRKWQILGNKNRQDSDSDTEHSANPRRHDSESDQSLPRRKRHDSDSDQSQTRRERHDSDSDQSQPRRKRHDSDSDQSPPRRTRHDSDSDQSPLRRKRHDSDSDQSPPRRKRPASDSDQSPPRRKRHGSDSDQSPPRRKRPASDSDQSPPRRKRPASDSDQSPPRRKRHGSDSDQSPPRRKKGHDFKSESDPKKRKSRWGSEENIDKLSASSKGSKDDKGRPKKTLGGATAGLSSAQQMKHEIKLMRKLDDDAFNKMDDEQLGRNAKTVFREKGSGRHRNFKEEEKLTAEEEAKKAEKEEKYKAWNKGLKQAQVQQRAVEEALHEMSKPLTRRHDDEDLDQSLKAQDRDGDPMLAFIKKKKTGKDSKKKELPRYRGPEPPPNRFNIWPGYRWDGVDRSNGFEKKVFAKVSEKKSIKEIAYKWSVEDM